jgi:hypothetical protein
MTSNLSAVVEALALKEVTALGNRIKNAKPRNNPAEKQLMKEISLG